MQNLLRGGHIFSPSFFLELAYQGNDLQNVCQDVVTHAGIQFC